MSRATAHSSTARMRWRSSLVVAAFGGSSRHYTATITPAASGTVTVDIAAGAAQDANGNPSSRADQFSIIADLTPIPAPPTLGAVALAVLLLAGSVRRRTQH